MNLIKILTNSARKILEDCKKFYNERRYLSLFFTFVLVFDFGMIWYFTEKFPLFLLLPNISPSANTEEVIVYLPDREMVKLIEIEKEIYSHDSPSRKIESIFDALAARPDSEKTLRAIPGGVFLRRVWIHKNKAILDLEKEAKHAKPKNPDAETIMFSALAKSIIKNVTGITEIQILIDGKPVDFLWGGMDLRSVIKVSSGNN